MILFIVGILLLVAGYFIYGRVVANSISPDASRPTPAVALADGIDFVPMPTWRVYLVQLLNIAGLGPIFGPIMGALWGPQVFLWIVFGAILGGAVHDFLAGAMSIRNKGAGLAALIGHYLGKPARHAATFFILLLMVLVGTVFVKAPADLIASLLPAKTVGGWLFGDGEFGQSARWESIWLWVVMAAIYVYYLVATLLPVDKIIGRVYPLFAIALLVMVAGLAWVTLFGDLEAPAFTVENLHPQGVPAWPIIFITVSCGAISGFHATQSPMMARCLKSEKHMRFVFYGAMIAEGLIALIWASASQGYYGSVTALSAALGESGPAGVVHTVCTSTMGTFGGVLALLGVVVLPITSGDTAFRVARLIVADYTHLSQEKILNRYKIALPLFGLSLALQFIPFGVIWRYFGWANQTLAAVALWTGAVFLVRRGRNWWLAALPATFMTIITGTYILVADEGLGLSNMVGTVIGLVIGAAALGLFLYLLPRMEREPDMPTVDEGPTEAERESDSLAS